ncbi:helix-turn-helix domain-containing protein [Henriciella sp.]|uniref:helix-turn-helix domain-containing protein n=1 Tax=Henriciella sp. TaxID=1968823 RepID=UPI002613BEEE|nr:helix-turn-helix domain-containing protein [Henriciella sp.]
MKRVAHHNDIHNVRLAAGLTGFALRLPAETILSFDQREHRIARARQVAMYLCHVVLGMSLARIATAMGRDRSTVAHGCHRVEDFRDDPEIDAWLDDLESRLRVAANPVDVTRCQAHRQTPAERLQLI